QELSVPWTYSGPGTRVRDAHSHAVEQWTAAGVLVNSSNVGMVELGQQLDRDDFTDYLDRFGFGERTAVGFAGEQDVALRDLGALDPEPRLNALFGQGSAAAPCQLASAYQAMGNGGVHLPVQLIAGCTDAEGELTAPQLPDGQRVVRADTARSTL